MTAFVYVIFSYGGIRSPDSEVVFRTAEALATKGTFSVSKRIAGLGSFGLPPGVDGRYYSLFGPGQSVACVPLVTLGMLLNKTGWYEGVAKFIPISHYVGGGILAYVKQEIPRDVKPHALRFIVSAFNVIIGALCVFFFFLLVRLLTHSDFAAWCSAVLFAFGTLMMPYSGTFFSEPLSTLFVILSLFSLAWNDLDNDRPMREKYFSLLSAGIFLGLGVTVHISAILFVPPFAIYAVYPFVRTHWSARRCALSGSVFSAGVGLFLVVLGYYNDVRFGNVLETGRTALPNAVYSTFVAPWRGLFGLVFSSGKGLAWYCPAVVISLFFWRQFHKRYPALSFTILGSVLLRYVFIAGRSDWHGGFSLGPRYMVMVIPLMMVPFGFAFAEWMRRTDFRSLWLFFAVGLVCVVEQIYFSLGEIFSFLHIINWTYQVNGINVFQNDALYLDWDKSPLLFLLDARRGPFLMQFIHVSNGSLFGLCAALAAVLLSFGYARLMVRTTGRWY